MPSGIKINELPRAAQVSGSNLIAVESPAGTGTEAATVEQLRDYVAHDALEAISEAAGDAVEAVEEKGAETLASIPEDYTKITGDVADLKSAFIFTDIVDENGQNNYLLTYTNNAMNDNTGAQGSANAARASTPALYYVPENCDIKVSNYSSSVYRASVYCFGVGGAYIGKITTNAVIPNQILQLLDGTKFLRFFVIHADASDITPEEAAQAITYTAIYRGRVKEIENSVDEINDSVDNIQSEIDALGNNIRREIKVDIIPDIPYKVFRSNGAYTAETPVVDNNFYQIYVDSVNGDDAKDGTAGNAVKTLTRADYLARTQMNNNAKDVVINVADDSVFYYDDIPESYNASKSLVIRAENRATIVAGRKPSFSASGNHYISEALTSYTPIGVIDMGAVDDYGLFAPLSKVDSESLVDSTPGSYYIDTTNKIAYVRPFASSSINNVVVIFSNKYAMNPSTYGFTRSSFVYLKNITFVGNSTATGRAVSTSGESIVRTIYAEKCIFQHGFTNNVVSFNDFDYTYIVDCVSGYGKYDCFNYHFTRKPTPTAAVVVEVNSASKEAGYYNTASGYSDNLTTCHEGANILRCGSHGYNANGGMCADVNGCYSVCVDCTFVNTSYVDTAGAQRPAFYFTDATPAPRNGKSVLQNCFGFDSRNNKMVEAVDLILGGNNSGGLISASTISVIEKVI